MSTKISIIVPIFNVEKYLEQCLNSLVNQTLNNIEIICVNDGSTDNSLMILKEYEKRYSNLKIIDKPNAGYGAAVNIGFKNATGEYLGIVEPDDFCSLEMYDKLYQAVKNKEKPDIVKAGYWDFYDDENGDITKIQIGMKLGNETIFTLSEHPEILRIHPSVWSCIYKKDFLQKNNIRMIEAKGAGWVDNPFFFETMYKAKSICWVADAVYYYRQTNIDASSNLKDCSIPIQRMKEVFDFYEKEKILNERLKIELYKRTILYLKKIKDNPALTEENIKAATALIKRMDYKLVSKLTTDEINIYEYYGGKKQYKKVLDKVKQKYSKTKPYKIVRKIYKGAIFLKNNGVYLTYKRIKQEIPYFKPIKLPPKTGLRVLFIPSDNNRTSGAFLSMVALNCVLREKYNVDTFVVLPNPGHGEELLIKNKIPYTMIQSKDWVVPIDANRDSNFEKEIKQKKKYNKAAILRLQKLIKDNEFDLVHINTTYSYVGALAALKTKTPFVWHLREFLEEDQSNTLWNRKKGNELINKADRVVAISKSLYKKYENVIDKSRLVCIFNGIDATKFYNPEKIIMQESIVKFIFIGGFEYYKGQIEFAKACAKLCAKGYDFKINFIGTGRKDVKEQVEKILNDAGMKDKVIYHGYKNNVNDYLRETDISFTCSKSEAFGRTTVEAMLGGNLVIGADTAGTKDLIVHGETGLLYRQGDVDDLAEKMEMALNQPEMSRNIALKGQEYMYQNMTAEINADKVYNLYTEILR